MIVKNRRTSLALGQHEALKKFCKSSGWEAGVDGSVALITVGAGGSIDTSNLKDPIVAFVLGQKGLMFNLTLEGSKFTKLKK
jgi:lipid-binding SYLF domain-containing protein